MNETVKAALLAERRDALFELREREIEVGHAQRRLTTAEARVPAARSRVADVESFLRDNGVDLAAVDAEAEKARPAVNLGGQHSVVSGLGQSIGNLGTGYANGLGTNANNSLGACNTFDPTAGLVKALDEA